jgi:hypothetical protein
MHAVTIGADSLMTHLAIMACMLVLTHFWLTHRGRAWAGGVSGTSHGGEVPHKGEYEQRGGGAGGELWPPLLY